MHDSGTFLDELRYLRRQLEHERRQWPDRSKAIDEYEHQIYRAGRIYHEHIEAATRAAAAQMRTEGLGTFADALESGDYLPLSI